MSTKYTGGFITKSPVAPTTTAASGIWTLDQQQQAQKAGTWPSPPIFIEDLFSTYLVTGDGSAPAVNNGIDVSGQGGLVWIKKRSAAGSNDVFDTARGANLRLITNDTAAQDSKNLSFTSTGFSNYTFDSAVNYVSWTFREQPKFFDVVTLNYTSGAAVFNHSLGSVPGFVIVKVFDGYADNWWVYHRSLGNNQYLSLNLTSQAQTSTGIFSATDTTFTVKNGIFSASTIVAYLFAHDAGGFPVSGGGSTNGISCGTYTGTGSPFNVELGYEPQWVLVKKTSATGDWILMDTMRGMSMTTSQWLYPNTSGIEDASGTQLNPTATGFTVTSTGSGLNGGGATYIYIAIRRGPMKTPTVGTSVFSPEVQTPTAAPNSVAANSGFPIDWLPTRQSGVVTNWYQTSRLTNNYMSPNSTAAEASYTYGFDRMAGVGGGVSGWNTNSTVSYAFRRAPGFFDVVCYTGTLANLTLTHNLGVAPEMMIVKCRSSDMPGGIAANWAVYAAPQGNSKFALLNTTDLFGTSAVLWQATTPTASNFYVGAANYVNGSGQTYVAYLFASVAGVSKVGTYTGTGALQTVNCGFTSGARFVLIKRADTSGDWWLYNSASGISSGNDPYLLVNSTAAEVTGTNYVDTDTTGFKVTAAAPAGLNDSGGTFIFLAIA